MDVEEIILRITKLKSVYGEAARMCFDNPDLSKQLLMEYYKEILEERSVMEEHFGKDVVEAIITFAKTECR